MSGGIAGWHLRQSRDTGASGPSSTQSEGPLREAAWRTLAPVDPMPEPGEQVDAFSPQPGRCFRMVQSRQLQATHCRRRGGMEGGLAGSLRAQLVCGSVSATCAEAV